jgi:Flp pilus assembly protein TadB
MEPDEPKRIRDAISGAKRAAFDSGVAWSIWAAVWGFFVSMLALALFGEFDHLDLGYWKGFMLIMIVAVAAWVWWLAAYARGSPAHARWSPVSILDTVRG